MSMKIQGACNALSWASYPPSGGMAWRSVFLRASTRDRILLLKCIISPKVLKFQRNSYMFQRNRLQFHEIILVGSHVIMLLVSYAPPFKGGCNTSKIKTLIAWV